jgi:hypothetical protein
MRISKLPLIFALAFAPGVLASVCVPDLLSNYIALGATGCQIGPLHVVNFSFSLILSTVTINAIDITVTPTDGGDTLQLKFTSPKFDVSGSDTAKYLLAYTWDPGDVRGMEDIMDANSPTFPGFASVTTLACKDAAFTAAVCPTSTATLTVSDNGVTANLADSTTFSPPIGIVGLRNTLELDANGARSQITGFSNVLNLPEPATWAAGLLALGFLLAHRRRAISLPRTLPPPPCH